MTTFTSTQQIRIDPALRGEEYRTAIEVPITQGGVITDINVSVDIEHTWVSDLTLKLESPSGKIVTLIARKGGSGDNMQDTLFDDEATISGSAGRAPFTGSFTPQSPLSTFDGDRSEGTWVLSVTDSARLDGGLIKGWTLDIETAAPPVISTGFPIELNFVVATNAAVRAVFERAALRWSSIILGPSVPVVLRDGERVEGVKIDVDISPIDGQFGILGQAGPTLIRNGNFLPIKGRMQFDSADVAALLNSGQLENTILHEMGHVLGIGTLWRFKSLLSGAGGSNPIFTGAAATREWEALSGITNSPGVPVANVGGQGSRDAHFREAIFVAELMTPDLNPEVNPNPLSRMTIASLADIGYDVSFDAADPYTLPGRLQALVAGSDVVGAGCRCGIRDWVTFDAVTAMNIIDPEIFEG